MRAVKNSIRWRKQNSMKRIVATEKLQELSLETEFFGPLRSRDGSGTLTALYSDPRHICADSKTYTYLPGGTSGTEIVSADHESLNSSGMSIAQHNNETLERRPLMNWDQMKGNWKQFKGKAKEQWGKLTDDELDQVEGKRDQLVGKIQKQYGLSKEEAERQVGDWERTLYAS